MAQPDDTWKTLGWKTAYNGACKAVYELLDGTPVMIFDGADRLTVIVQEVSTDGVYTTEEAYWAARAPATV
jgi:hypothetical protein